MGGFTIANSRVLGCILGAILHGFYVCLFAIAMRRVIQAFQQGARYKVVPSILIALFALSTANITMQVTDNYRAILLYEGGVHKFYADYPTGTLLMAGSDLCSWLSINLADAFLIWRLFLIWNHSRYIIIMPIVMQLVGMGSGLATVIFEFGAVKYVVDKWAYTSIVMTVLLNVFVTTLICGRLWFVGRSSARDLASTTYSPNYNLYLRIIILLIESGAVYSSTILLWALLHAAKAVEAANVVSYISPPISAIVPTLISIRLNSAVRSASSQPTLPLSVASGPGGLSRVTTTHQTHIECYPMSRINSKTYEATIPPRDEQGMSEGCGSTRAPSLSKQSAKADRTGG